MDDASTVLAVMTDTDHSGSDSFFRHAWVIYIAEPGALIGICGPRVIEQTIRQKLPQGFSVASSC
jgi:acetyl-CoA carboxylase carboxyl transferase subunit beta